MRLVTKSDLDGLTCAMMLKEMGLISDIMLIDEKDIHNEKNGLCNDDIVTGLPFDERASLTIDYHANENDRLKSIEIGSKYIADPSAKSAARVTYNYYGRAEKFPNISEELIKTVDKVDSCDFTIDDITDPKDWFLFNAVLDERTGLDKAYEFKVSGYDLFMELIDFCRKHSDVNDILNLEDVKVRVDYLQECKENFKDQLSRVTKIDGRLAIADYRNEAVIQPGSRYYNHAMHPEAQIFARIEYINDKQALDIFVERSIVNKESKFDIGDLCITYGGEGRSDSGHVTLPASKADLVLPKFLLTMARS